MLDYQSLVEPVPRYSFKKPKAWNFTQKPAFNYTSLPIKVVEIPQGETRDGLAAFFALPLSLPGLPVLHASECRDAILDIYDHSKDLFKECKAIYVENPIVLFYMSYRHEKIKIYIGFDNDNGGKVVVEMF